MAGPLQIREISSLEETREAAALIDRIWGEARILTPELLRAIATHGGLVLGAFRQERMVGTQMAFLGMEEGHLLLHSHVTGVAPEEQSSGVGFELKRTQRGWCLERGIDVVTWTFDPLISRNAHFNLRKLGATAIRFLRDFYGPMEDSINVGERTDRLEVRWELASPRVEAAMQGRPTPESGEDAEPLLTDDGGRPVRHGFTDAARLLVSVPRDHEGLRAEDRAAAIAWREAVADVLEEAMARGYRAIDFPGAYLLERA